MCDKWRKPGPVLALQLTGHLLNLVRHAAPQLLQRSGGEPLQMITRPLATCQFNELKYLVAEPQLQSPPPECVMCIMKDFPVCPSAP